MDPSARTDLGDGAWYDYDPGWLPEGEASDLFTRLAAEQAWEHRPIVVFGKEILQPRLIAWAGELPYRYSGQTLPPRPMEGALAELTARVCAEVGVGERSVSATNTTVDTATTTQGGLADRAELCIQGSVGTLLTLPGDPGLSLGKRYGQRAQRVQPSSLPTPWCTRKRLPGSTSRLICSNLP